ncbi:MAG: hypothetical protein AAB605_02590, partial [Patescibacteria group bacterium]
IANLARERGSYKHFEDSGWSKGMVPLDSITRLEEDRGMQTGMKRESKNKQLNWDTLRAKVQGGMRNATLMAVAPNANIGLVAGTTPGIDPRFAQVFSRNKISGKYMDINHNLVKDLKNMGLWEDAKEKIVEQQGDISAIPEIPSYLKQIYKTSFTTSPYAFVEIAARAQKWVDQALSRNIYLENRDMDEMKTLYMTAWKRGLKTTYYLHMKPRHTAEQSTTNVNKAVQIGKRGFAGVVATPVFTTEELPTISPIQKSPIEVPEMVPLNAPRSGASGEHFAAQNVVAGKAEAPLPAETSSGFVPVAAQGALPITPAAQQNLPEIASAAPVMSYEKPRMGFATVMETAAVPAPAAPTPAPAPAAALNVSRSETSGEHSAKQNVIAQKKAFVCPIDPAERAQCDACQ